MSQLDQLQIRKTQKYEDRLELGKGPLLLMCLKVRLRFPTHSLPIPRNSFLTCLILLNKLFLLHTNRTIKSLPSSMHPRQNHCLEDTSVNCFRPPREASLEPVHLSLRNSPAPTDCSISPDRLPNKSLFFISTPKSKPLKELLPESV